MNNFCSNTTNSLKHILVTVPSILYVETNSVFIGIPTLPMEKLSHGGYMVNYMTGKWCGVGIPTFRV